MTDTQFAICVHRWLTSAEGPKEHQRTSALMSFVFDNEGIEILDEISKSSGPEIRLSAYPLALWFLACWWRLRWEPAPLGRPTNAWRLAHETRAVGEGFVWPALTFAWDGENIEVTCNRTDSVPTEPFRYLSQFHVAICAKDFEQTVDEFVDKVLGRLGAEETVLSTLRAELWEERTDPTIVAYRRLEAQLGFDPDEASEALINEFQSVSTQTGQEALSEIAPACAGEDADAALRQLIDLTREDGIQGEISIAAALAEHVGGIRHLHTKPWERGRELAHAAREAWGIEQDTISDPVLGSLLSISQATFQQVGPGKKQCAGLAIRKPRLNRLAFLFRKRNRPGRRFEAARLIADHLIAPADDLWLPATDTQTARQKIQRSFAAEFLCPISALQEYLGSDLSDESIEDASGMFGVSPLAVRSHLANHDLIPVESVGA